MAGTYPDETTVERDAGDGLVTDQRVKWFGVGVAALFTSGVFFLLYWILSDYVDYDLLVGILPRFFDAYVLVLQIVVASSVLSLVGGVLVGLGRVSRTTFTRSIATGYVEFFRGTPLLFQIFIIYLGIPAFWPPGQFPISNWNIPTAVIALSLNHAAYAGEAIKGGITSVPDGQMEAARSLGMSYIGAMREVIMPQAARNALAALGNDQVILVKDTSLLTVIAVPEIMSVFRNVNSNQFDAWTPIVLVAVAYLAITLPLGKLVRYLEGRAEWGETDE